MSDVPVFKSYLYSGPVQSVNLKAKNADGEMVIFFEDCLCPGKTYLLLDDHPIVKAWKDANLITLVQGETS